MIPQNSSNKNGVVKGIYGIEKACSVVEISRDEFAKNAKIVYILMILKFSIGEISKFLILAPDQFLDPILGLVGQVNSSNHPGFGTSHLKT